jgi:hypothetical protein
LGGHLEWLSKGKNGRSGWIIFFFAAKGKGDETSGGWAKRQSITNKL